MKRTVSLLLALVLLLTLCGCGKKDDDAAGAGSWQEQYDLGVRYLSDGNYEEAIIAFTAAIEIDSKRPEAYLGLADAYTGTGDLDAARKALEDGLVATGDADIQSRLDELSAEAGNLTGQPPFTLQDLEDWGYPYGVDVYELRTQGAIYDYEGYETVDQWITRNLENCQSDIQSGAYERNRGGSLLRHNNPIIAVYNTMDMNIMSVKMEEGDTCTGPRGIHLGMEAEDVLRMFQCDNSDAIKYLQTGDESLLTGNEDRRDIDLYDLHDDDDNAWYGYLSFLNIKHYESGVLSDEEYRLKLQYTIWSHEHSLASLDIDITDGIVSEIDVYYEYWD